MSLRSPALALVIVAACAPTNRVQMAGAPLDIAPSKPNAQMQAVLDQLGALNPKPITELSAPAARKQPSPADAVKALLKKEGKSTAPMAVGNVEDRMIPGPGGQIAVRIYTPKGTGPFPALVYYHGGGWVIADLDTYDASPRAMVNMANTVVVSSHYRQGPEHKFPAAHEDAFAAYQWVLKNAKALKADSSKVAVMGESAGGNLAAAVSMMARDSGVQLPLYQVLVYPIAGYDVNTPSYQENASAKPLNKPMMQWFFHTYLRTPADGRNPLIDLVNADLQGLPASTVITAQIDPLRSEGKQLADKLKDAGVQVDYRNYGGVTHEFFGMGAVVDEAKQAEQQAAMGLKKGFSMGSSTPSQQ